MAQDTFDAQTSALLESLSFDFFSFLKTRLPEDVLDLDNQSEDDLLSAFGDMFNEIYKKTTFIPKLPDIDDVPERYLSFLGGILGVEDFDLIKARLAGTSASEPGEINFDIEPFRRFVKEAIFRYRKKGTDEAVEKILFYLTFLIETEELFTRNWRQYFPESELVSEMLKVLGGSQEIEVGILASQLFQTDISITSSLSTSGSTDTISDITSAGEVQSLIKTFGGHQWILVESGSSTKLFRSEAGAFIDTELDGTTAIEPLTHTDFGDTENVDLKRGLVGIIRAGEFFILREDDHTFVENSFNDKVITEFVHVFDGTEQRFLYFETADSIFRADGQLFSILEWINKTQYDVIPTVDAEYVIPMNDDERIYFFTLAGQPEDDRTILARGWIQETNLATTTIVPSSAAITSGPATSAFADGTTVIYGARTFGKFTSGLGTFQFTLAQDTSSCETSGVTAFDEALALFYEDDGPLDDGDPAEQFFNDGVIWHSTHLFNCAVTIDTSGSDSNSFAFVPMNTPDFRIQGTRYKFDVFKNEATPARIDITYQKGEKLYRTFFDRTDANDGTFALPGRDPHNREVQVMVEDVLRYLSFAEDDTYVYRLYIKTDLTKKLLIENKKRSVDQPISFKIFNVS